MGQHAAMLAGRIAATQAGVQLLDRQHEARALNSSAAREATQILKELTPDVVFCPQRPYIIAPFSPQRGPRACRPRPLFSLGQHSPKRADRESLRSLPGLERTDAVGTPSVLP